MNNLDRLIDELNKVYGGKVPVIRPASELEPLRSFPFGISTLDLDLGGGALFGRTTLLAGEKGTGKTSLGYQLCGNAQKEGIPIFSLDLEKSFDSERAKIFGLNPENVMVVRGELTAETSYSM